MNIEIGDIFKVKDEASIYYYLALNRVCVSSAIIININELFVTCIISQDSYEDFFKDSKIGDYFQHQMVFMLDIMSNTFDKIGNIKDMRK